jgi:hypothetical protein
MTQGNENKQEMNNKKKGTMVNKKYVKGGFRGVSPLIYLVIVLALALVFVPVVFGLPLPQGVDGMVYDMDNLTRADSSVWISLDNLNNAYFISGRLRDDGSFSAALRGETGDEVKIMLWNEKHNSTYIMMLDGVIRGLRLNLNLSGTRIIHDDSNHSFNHTMNSTLNNTLNDTQNNTLNVTMPGNHTLDNTTNNSTHNETGEDEGDDDNETEDQRNETGRRKPKKDKKNGNGNNGPRDPKVITGLINYGDDSPADDIPYVIKNLRTGENKSGRTKGFNGFSEVIYGEEGDGLEIEVGNEKHSEKINSMITGAVTKADIGLEIPGWLYHMKQIDLKSVLFYLSMALISFLPLLMIWRAIRLKKNE